MRSLQARFLAIAAIAIIIAIAGLVAIRDEQQAHDGAVSAAVQAIVQQHGATQQQPAIDAIAQADQRYQRAVLLTFVAFGLLESVNALLAWYVLVQPMRRLAETVRRIETGDSAMALMHSSRRDEIGELARAFGSIHNTLVAMRKRADHEAAPRASQSAAASKPAQAAAVAQPAAVPRSPKAGGTMVMSDVRDPAVEQARLAEMNRAKWDGGAAASSAPSRPALLSPREQRLEDDLREAWQRGEIGIVYQPIHALVDGGMRGAEAFLRWQHPVEGAVSPSVFIPIAERSDLIDTLGRAVLVQACSDASLWPCGNAPEQTPFLSVNISAKQLRGTQLFEAIIEALQKSGLAAARLHLELPVAALRSDDPQIAAMIEQLRGLGVQIWLDVVGADAADQSRWMKMSVTGVKVGRSRIAGKSDDAADAAATGAIVATAHALRVVAVVVGVEELAQLDLLRAQGADLAQGYVLCKPVDTAEITRRLLA